MGERAPDDLNTALAGLIRFMKRRRHFFLL